MIMQANEARSLAKTNYEKVCKKQKKILFSCIKKEIKKMVKSGATVADICVKISCNDEQMLEEVASSLQELGYSVEWDLFSWDDYKLHFIISC